MTSGSSSSVLSMTWVVRFGFVIMTTITIRSIMLITVAIYSHRRRHPKWCRTSSGSNATGQHEAKHLRRVLLIEALVAQQVLFTLSNQAVVAGIFQNHSKHNMRHSPRQKFYPAQYLLPLHACQTVHNFRQAIFLLPEMTLGVVPTTRHEAFAHLWCGKGQKQP